MHPAAHVSDGIELINEPISGFFAEVCILTSELWDEWDSIVLCSKGAPPALQPYFSAHHTVCPGSVPVEDAEDLFYSQLLFPSTQTPVGSGVVSNAHSTHTTRSTSHGGSDVSVLANDLFGSMLALADNHLKKVAERVGPGAEADLLAKIHVLAQAKMKMSTRPAAAALAIAGVSSAIAVVNTRVA